MIGQRGMDVRAGWSGHVEIPPVDAQIVAGLREYGLVKRTHPQHFQPFHLRTRPEHRLRRLIDHQFGRVVVVDGNLVFARP